MKNGEGGFTLIALPAVVAMIGLLAAIGTVAMIGVLHREPTHVKPLPIDDGWSSPIAFTSTGAGYTLVSWGGDSRPSLPWTGGVTHRTADDIVLSNDQLYPWPEGVQHPWCLRLTFL
ncbi:MAG: hypothetical protein GXP47_01215 [Acidobacteria bacterium]|nr:hypothetical protein [Acidobacteriota bacterium]